MIILNYKTYAESTGGNSEKLLRAVEEASKQDPNVSKYVSSALSIVDLVNGKKAFPNVNIMAQHVDNKAVGSTTGWVTPENLTSYGIEYSVYNHSEHRVSSDSIVEDIKSIQSRGIKVIACCENVEEANKLLEAQPFGIAYEPKDLIGSGVSVTTRPEAVKEFIEATKGKTMVLIGAGVSTGEDVAKGLELGAEGFLLASAFVKAQDPVAKVLELTKPYSA